MARLWRLKLGSKETQTLVTKATGRRRDIDETLMQHDVRASREAAGTRLSSNGTIDIESEPVCADARQTRKHCMLNTVALLGNTANGRVAKPSRIRRRNRESESHGTVRRMPERASSWRVRVAPPELMGGSSRTVLTSKQTSQILEQIGTGRPLATVQYVRHAKESRSRVWRDLTTEGSIQEARHKNETQLKSEDTILNRTPKGKRTRQSR